ncbi:hypothetical protein Goshw_001873, partial [Gossypium schwendimanii]|nr:hypothetical protein [Gossypium schwendimanii]
MDFLIRWRIMRLSKPGLRQHSRKKVIAWLKDMYQSCEIWDQWNDEVKQLFYSSYGDLPYLLDIKKLINITGMSEQWVAARIKQKGDSKCISWKNLRDLILAHPDTKKKVDVFALSVYGLVVFPKALGHVDEVVTDLFDR